VSPIQVSTRGLMMTTNGWCLKTKIAMTRPSTVSDPKMERLRVELLKLKWYILSIIAVIIILSTLTVIVYTLFVH